MRKTVLSFAVVVGFICILTSSARGDMVVMTFDTEPPRTLNEWPDKYVENGMKAIQVGAYVYPNGHVSADIGDPLGQSYGSTGNGTNGLYFHGIGAYVEISRVDGSSFDLFSLDLLTNGGAGRWLTTSSGTHFDLPGPTTIATISFSDSGYSDIEWFRVYTDWSATQIDNVTVSAVPVPGAVLLGAIGLSVAGWRLKRKTV